MYLAAARRAVVARLENISAKAADTAKSTQVTAADLAGQAGNTRRAPIVETEPGAPRSITARSPVRLTVFERLAAARRPWS
jgi:hypothetical protein